MTDAAAAVRRREPQAGEKLTRCLALGGMAAEVVGKTAPLSGTEHLVSHLLDMVAGKHHLPFNFHGAQVGVATVPEAFAELDPTGEVGEECWSDYALKVRPVDVDTLLSRVRLTRLA